MKAPSTEDVRPARTNLGPTGPKKLPKTSVQDYEQKHPNPGTVAGEIGPHPTADPAHKVERFKRKLEQQR